MVTVSRVEELALREEEVQRIRRLKEGEKALKERALQRFRRLKEEERALKESIEEREVAKVKLFRAEKALKSERLRCDRLRELIEALPNVMAKLKKGTGLLHMLRKAELLVFIEARQELYYTTSPGLPTLNSFLKKDLETLAGSVQNQPVTLPQRLGASTAAMAVAAEEAGLAAAELASLATGV
mmetsp:Transcript_26585/g.57835  ORF Transcript_26585/g.57835 Transcript_26585/m.57835 type:complete len:184 (-) Transcript_26585:1046-1597(-)